MSGPYFERFLFVVGDSNTGKSAQMRSMLLDPKIGWERTNPESGNIPRTYRLSNNRFLYLRLQSPHEKLESLEEFLKDISNHVGYGRWCVAAALQISPDNRITQSLPEIISAIDIRFNPERIRVCLLSPDYRENFISNQEMLTLVSNLQSVSSCEVITIDARDRQANGLLLADTFDFT